jgi:hypothetical protein
VPVLDMTGMPVELPLDEQYVLPELQVVGRLYDSVILSASFGDVAATLPIG